MRSPDELRAKTDSLGLEISECTVNQFEHSKSLYALVGGTWQWTGKQAWSDDDWRDYAEGENLRTFIASLEGATAGYFELQSQMDGDVEIAYFGLAPAFIGRGTSLMSTTFSSTPFDKEKPRQKARPRSLRQFGIPSIQVDLH